MTKKKTLSRKARQSVIASKRLLTETHLRMPIAEWRLKKRQEWRVVMNALALFTYGCGYTPAGNDLYELQRAADRINAALDADWVCW
jgi:hypothetical protein